ncbi:hypothetical protein, partial [Pacificibacter marinus]|uniref:hypothetical protein n=1 Tax=Pacificibacter marinus TaxID=658057 RepID=UPI001C38E2BE
MKRFYALLRFNKRTNLKRWTIADFRFIRSITSFILGPDMAWPTGFAVAANVSSDGPHRSSANSRAMAAQGR